MLRHGLAAEARLLAAAQEVLHELTRHYRPNERRLAFIRSTASHHHISRTNDRGAVAVRSSADGRRSSATAVAAGRSGQR